MNKSIKTLACAVAISFLLLACEDTGTNAGTDNSIGKNNPCKIKALSKTCNDERCWYDESDSVFFRPYDPNWVSIEESIKDWMEEQLATESNDTGLFIIMDFFIHENYVNLLDISGPTEQEYYVDGKRISYEEYREIGKLMEEYEQERKIRGKRNLPIPNPIFYETDYSWVGVPMTAKELAELTENYKLIAVEFYREAVNDDMPTIPTVPGGNGGSPSPPCD